MSLKRELLEWARGHEYYADAYVGENSPFPDRVPHSDELCKSIQECAMLIFKYFKEEKRENKATNELKEQDIYCRECGNENMKFGGTYANGESWICNICKTENMW